MDLLRCFFLVKKYKNAKMDLKINTGKAIYKWLQYGNLRSAQFFLDIVMFPRGKSLRFEN
jgi:hypothetical protein